MRFFLPQRAVPLNGFLPRQWHSQEATGMLYHSGFQKNYFCPFSVLVAFLGVSGVSFRVLSSVSNKFY